MEGFRGVTRLLTLIPELVPHLHPAPLSVEVDPDPSGQTGAPQCPPRAPLHQLRAEAFVHRGQKPPQKLPRFTGTEAEL